MAKKQPTLEMIELLRRCGSKNKGEALAAQAEMSLAIQLPLRDGIMNGDILNGLFEPADYTGGTPIEYPLDVLAPGTEKEQVAYTIPNHGRLPEKTFEGDYVMIPTYRVGSAVDWLLKHARDANWNIVGRILSILESHFVVKMNNDGWHVLLSAAVDRNIVVYDSDAAAGQFTKRLVSLMKTVMLRNGGGNTASQNRRQLTDLFMSPENKDDMRNWGVESVDDTTRREIWMSADGGVDKIFGVILHDLNELGENQEFQLYFTNELGGSLASSDVELVVGMDLRNPPFVMPIRENVSIFEDETMHRQGREGHYGWAEFGLACLDNRYIILGSC